MVRWRRQQRKEVLARLAALEAEAVNARRETAAARQEAAAATVRAAAAEQRAQTSDAVIARLASLPNDVAVAIATATEQSKRGGRQLTDPKGLGKPPHFKGDEAEFAVWSKKTENYVKGVFPEIGDLLRQIAEDAGIAVDLNVIKADPATPDDAVVDELNAQTYSVLMALT